MSSRHGADPAGTDHEAQEAIADAAIVSIRFVRSIVSDSMVAQPLGSPSNGRDGSVACKD